MVSKADAPKRVQLLPPAVAERIAAGEVIERPASVVKELVENALDAGATEIAVILEDGGKGLIEVIDNGHGMSREDLELCVQRHATSKISTLDDLDRLRTLGFRGEALPSIAAVSNLTITSRGLDSDTAYEVQPSVTNPNPRAKAVTFGHFLGSPHGTRMRAEALFSHIPARLKFLKAARSEVGNVRDWLERLALGRPEVGFRLISGDRPVLELRPQSPEDRVRAILADEAAAPVVRWEEPAPGVPAGEGAPRVVAYWLQGYSSPQTRKLVQVVNGRALRDRMLQQAVLSPFKQALLPGQFPALALFLEVDPSDIDVNVHPTKTEVRFRDSRAIFGAIHKALERMIAKEGAPAFAAPAARREPVARTLSLSDAPAWKTRTSFPQAIPHGVTSEPPTVWRAGESPELSIPDAGDGLRPPHDGSDPHSEGGLRPSRPLRVGASSPNATEENSENEDRLRNARYGESLRHPPSEWGSETAGANPATHALSDGRYVGILFNTYVLFDCGEEAALVDQHAAHERIRYERLRRSLFARDRAPDRQDLLIPEAVRVREEDKAAIEERLPLLESLGFDAELFGEESLLFRGIPAAWGTDSLRVRLRNLVDRVLEIPPGQAAGADGLLIDEPLFEAIASEACHSAVRAGDRLDERQAVTLVNELFSCEHPWNCPHGRPTVVRVPSLRFEEWFRRKV